MKYFKNTELAKLYHVSEKSVRNWIESVQAGRLDLELVEEKNRTYIANTSRNTLAIEKLVQRGKKYKNTRGRKVIQPSARFYEVFDGRQILDIVSSIAVHKEIPHHYGYLDGGAEAWDLYANRLAKEQVTNILNTTSNLLEINQGYIDQLLSKHRKVNVVDLGPGNGLPIRSTLEQLLASGRLNRYIAIDISQNMLDILRRNIKEWFGDNVIPECYVRNFTEERFDDIIAEDYSSNKEDIPANLVTFFGGTLSNFRLPDYLLRTINNSLSADDLFFYSGFIDTPYIRRHFDVGNGSTSKDDLRPSSLIPKLMQIDTSVCNFEMLFNEQQLCRFRNLVPKIDLTIEVSIDGKARSIELRKNEPIVIWRHKHFSYSAYIDLFEHNDFNVMQATRSADQNYILLLARIRTI